MEKQQKNINSISNTPPLGKLYEVNGRRLMLHHSGNGGPAVVFLCGSGMVGLDYLNVHEEISKFTTSVIYDRGGTGWSDDVALPRSAAEVTDELRSLLRKAGIPAPYILVGHSLGGHYARRYAQRFPDEVAGLLMMESAHEDYNVYVPKRSKLETLQGLWSSLKLSLHYKKFYRDMFGMMFASWPVEVREPLIEYHIKTVMKTFKEWPAAQRYSDVGLNGEVRNGGPLSDVPLIALCCTGIEPSMAATMSSGYLAKLNDGKRPLYTMLANSVSHGEYREVDNAGHSTLHTDRPDAVIGAVRDLVDQVNNKDLVSTCVVIER